MSFFEDASLVFIPSAQKSGKAYSVKPTDGTGDLTFTRSNDTATRVGPDGLIEKVRTNLLLQSNSFDTTWVKGGSLTSGQSGYDGSSDAWLYTTTAAGQRIEQSTTITGVQTISVYAKAGNLDWILLNIGGGFFGAYFDLANGVVGSTQSSSGGVTIDTKIQAIGSGWYRISVSGNYSSTSSFRIYTASDDLVTAAGNIYIQDAQLEQGLVATDYIETTTAAVSVGPVANVPRLDYLDSSCPRLILEGQRTNILPQSNFFASADWVKLNTSITSNSTTSPEGYANASKLTENSSTGFHATYDSIGAAFSTVHTFSAFVKPSGRSIIYLRMENASTGGGLGITYFNVSTGQILTDASTSSSIEAYANGWYRVSITATTPAAASTLFSIGLADADNSRSYTGDGTSGAYIYGAQVEANATYPSSYVPTFGAAVTRGADACSKTGISSLIGQTEGTLYTEVEFTKLTGTVPREWFIISDGTTSATTDWVTVSTSGAGNNLLRARIAQAGAIKFDQQYTIPTTGTYKIAFAYKSGDCALYVNGVSVGTVVTNSAFTLSLDQVITAFTSGTFQLGDGLKQALVFKTRLSNSDLAALTA